MDDEGNGSPFAVVKVIRPSLLGGDSVGEDHRARVRFAREIDAVRAVVSHRTPRLFAAEAEAEQPWMAMEYVPGPTLGAMVSRAGTFSVAPYAALGLAVAEALRAIHDMGLLHRDLKPGNVVLGPAGPVVLDFGIAVLAERQARQAVTRTGTTLGTAAYMPLEQAEDAKHVDRSADVYSLGATLFFAATGRPPYSVAPLPTESVWDGVDPEFRPLLARMLVQISERRPSLDEVEQSLLTLLNRNRT
ncbi:hypothetical protein N566_18240, partial [Streptomycetaceae bacterium MP113-05]